MPRKARVIVPYCSHHIVQRGHNRNAGFIADNDYPYYLDNIKELQLQLDIAINAYCLMTNPLRVAGAFKSNDEGTGSSVNTVG